MQRSLKGKVVVWTVVPLLILAAFIGGACIKFFSKSMIKQVDEQMVNQSKLIKRLYDDIYQGDFSINIYENGTYQLYKGDKEITGDYSILDSFQQTQGMEASIFYQKYRVLTTFKDTNDKRYVGTLTAPQIMEEIEEKEEGAFFKNVTINDVESFAYYEPIILSDGSFFGMIEISQSAETVNKLVYQATIPIVIVCVFATAFLGYISLLYANALANRIIGIRKFIKKVSEGDFEADLPSEIINLEDELGDLAKNGKKMQQSIRHLVEVDVLTELNNRRYGEKRLLQVREKAVETGCNYSVAIGDIDYFKKVNDTYGHEAGDEVLKAVSLILKKNMVGKGFVSRWGGEEFLLVFQKDNLEDTLKVLKVIEKQIRELTVCYRDIRIKVTMSFGITEAKDEEGVDEVLKVADELLYLAKEQGRNQIKSSARES